MPWLIEASTIEAVRNGRVLINGVMCNVSLCLELSSENISKLP